MARNYTAGERSLIMIGIMAGKSCDEINNILIKDQKRVGASERKIPLGTYFMIKERYFPALEIPTETPNWVLEVYEHVLHPKSAKDLCTISQLEVNSETGIQLKLFGDLNV